MITEREKKEILIIEDETDVRFLLTSLLKKNGFISHACATLECGRSVLKSNIYDVVILDINLTDGNGLSLLENHLVPQNTRVVVMSAHTDMKAKALELGAYCFIPKPFSTTNILTAIQ